MISDELAKQVLERLSFATPIEFMETVADRQRSMELMSAISDLVDRLSEDQLELLVDEIPAVGSIKAMRDARRELGPAYGDQAARRAGLLLRGNTAVLFGILRQLEGKPFPP